MKPIVVVFLLASTFSLALSASVVRRDVQETAKAKMELISMLKWDDLAKVVMEYLYRDPEVQDFVRYLGSEEFKEIVKELDATSEYQEVLAYLKKAGIHAVKVHNVLHVLLGLPTLPVEADDRDLPIVGGLKGLMQDLAGAVDKEAFMAWLRQWKSTDLFEALMNLPAQPFVETLTPKLTNLPQVKALVAKMESLGLKAGALPALQ